MMSRHLGHVRLTGSNYFGYATVSFWAGIFVVGFGAIDLVMVAPFGTEQVAAVGQADLLVTAFLAGVLGFSDVYATRLAQAEGSGQTTTRGVPLFRAICTVGALLTAFAGATSFLIQPLLHVLNQLDALIPMMSDYMVIRIIGSGIFLIYYASNETLKICGHRKLAIFVLLLGLAANAGLNGLFLYIESVAQWFSSPTTAVAWASVASECVMALAAGVLVFYVARIHPAQPGRETDPFFIEVSALLRIGIGVGARRFNDYISALIPLLLIGTISVAAVAAAAVATRIYMIFCRVPQATFATGFIFYGYALGGERDAGGASASALVRPLLQYSGLITAAGLVITLATLPLSLKLFGVGIDPTLAMWLLAAYLFALPAYVLEQFYAQLHVAHERSRFLLVSTSAVTYLLVLPMSWLAAQTTGDPFWIIACRGLGSVVLAYVFVTSFYQHTSIMGPVRHVR